MSRIVGFGAGGHAKVVLDILRLNPEHVVVGLLDREIRVHGTRILEVLVLGGDELLQERGTELASHFFVGVGTIGDNTLRIKLFERGKAAGLQPVDAIHPAAVIAASARLGSGVTVMAGAVINPCTQVGENVLINTGAIVEHDCVLGAHAHVAPGACVLGGVNVGAAVHVGARAVIRQGLTIGESAIIGAGAVVTRDIPPHTKVVGVPAKPMHQTEGR